MLLAPYAVFGLIADISTRVGIDVLLGMPAYVGTSATGFTHAVYCLYAHCGIDCAQKCMAVYEGYSTCSITGFLNLQLSGGNAIITANCDP